MWGISMWKKTCLTIRLSVSVYMFGMFENESGIPPKMCFYSFQNVIFAKYSTKKILLECWESNPCSQRVRGWGEGGFWAGRRVPCRTWTTRPRTVARVCLSSSRWGPVLTVRCFVKVQVSEAGRRLLEIVRCLPKVGGCPSKLGRCFWFIPKVWGRCFCVPKGPSVILPRGELSRSFYSVKKYEFKRNTKKFSRALKRQYEADVNHKFMRMTARYGEAPITHRT